MALEPRLFANGGPLGASPLCWIWARGGGAAAPRSIRTSAMLFLGVLHTSHYRLHKKAGMFFLILMYPRPCRAKNGVFSTASSAGAAAVGWHCGDRRHFGVRRGARHACLSRRGPSADPNRRPKATVGLIRCARCVCICPGLLKTPKNAQCSPGDPCAQRKPCPCRYPHRHFAALTFLDAGLELVNLPPVRLRRGGA